MRKVPFAATLFSITLGCLLQAAPVQAQATRTWVSGTGDDMNDCSRGTPCKTFSVAIGKTATFGEINCVDSGGFGSVTITKSITIDCDNVLGGVLVSGTNGILVNVATTDTVVLRGLDFDGITTGLAAVAFIGGGVLHVQHCRIQRFLSTSAGFGINFAPNAAGSQLIVDDTTVIDNIAGILISPSAGGSAFVSLDHVRVAANTGGGVKITNAGTLVTVAILNSNISGNGGNGVVALSGPGNVAVHVDHTVIASNGSSGVQSNQTGGGFSNVTVRGSMLTNNANGNVNFFGGGTLLTFGDNDIVGAPGTGFSGPISQQ